MSGALLSTRKEGKFAGRPVPASREVCLRAAVATGLPGICFVRAVYLRSKESYLDWGIVRCALGEGGYNARVLNRMAVR